MDEQTLRSAGAALDKTSRGRQAMRYLLAWLDDSGLGLDAIGQEAVLELLDGAWGGFAGTARDVMREYVEPIEEKSHAR